MGFKLLLYAVLVSSDVMNRWQDTFCFGVSMTNISNFKAEHVIFFHLPKWDYFL